MSLHHTSFLPLFLRSTLPYSLHVVSAGGDDIQQSLLSAPHDSSQQQQPNYQSIHPPQPAAYTPAQPPRLPYGEQQHSAYYHTSPVPPNVPTHLQHRYRALQLPPYPKYATVKQQFFALSRLNQAFLVVVALLWPLAFLPASTRLVALFLPLLLVPTIILYCVYLRYYQYVEINVLMHTYVAAFTVGALVVLLLESLLTVIFASLTLYWQLDELVKWMLEQGGSKPADVEQTSDPFAMLSKTAGFFVFVFLVAFIVAGCVEDSMKYALTVRIKRITPAFADRKRLPPLRRHCRTRLQHTREHRIRLPSHHTRHSRPPQHRLSHSHLHSTAPSAAATSPASV